jgi:ribonuclease HII
MAHSGRPLPDLSLERAWAGEHAVAWVAGVDEAGRGALAGPVVAAAVLVLPNDDTLQARLTGVQDSKLVSPPLREHLFDAICLTVPAFAVGFAPAEWIDSHGILSATRLAMTTAVGSLVPPAEAILVDGPLPLVDFDMPQLPVVRGDQLSLSIAAASILAKVSRDRYMVALAARYPTYGFDRHKGYGTAEHLAALGRFGPCPEHRRSFAPLRHGAF